MRKQLTSFATGNKVFVKYQAQGGFLTPKPPPLRTPLHLTKALTWKELYIFINVV